MHIDAAKILLDTLTENALHLLRAGFGLNWLESTFFDVIRLLRQEEALKDYFLEKISATLDMREPGRLDPGMIPKELIELVAHEFRWPELQSMAQKRVNVFFRGDPSFAISDVADHIKKAFHDNWEDRDFYEHYKLLSDSVKVKSA